MKYAILADTYEKIESTMKRLEMTDLLVSLFKQTPNNLIDKVVYLTQGILYPDYRGIELGLAEKLTLKALKISSGRSDSEIERTFRETGDLGITAEKILTKRAQLSLFKEVLTAEKVYETLDKIARISGEGAIENKIRFLCSLFNDATPKEAKYIMRMAVGKLRLGIADMTILDALAIAYTGDKKNKDLLERGYNISSDLGYIANVAVSQGIEGINNVKIEIGKPIRVMLAERLSDPKEILEKLGGEGSIEYKYDGLRLQAHLGSNIAHLFSRRLENVTNQFPDVVDSLRKSIQVNEAVIEGECVAIDPDTEEMLPFQVISQRRGRKYDIKKMAEEIPVILFLFDILYVDGDDYTLKPYVERREKLRKIVKENDRVKISWQHIIKDPKEIEDFIQKAVAEGCEGLMVKSTSQNSIYKAGARGWTWIKYKRGYKSEMADTVDLVVVGAFYGKGKRVGHYGALLLAAYDKEIDEFKTVCKIGTGFTDEDLAEIPKKLKPYLLNHKHPRVNSKLVPDLWFTPSLVLEITGDEITLSPIHTASKGFLRPETGLAIRFPRFTGKYRTDKTPEDATTEKEILAMYKKQLKKLSI
ncbi:MAG: ATP-dependent DNA ligase [Candidatus Bathyarchaeota archaeon]|nr:ATP-dependent DNA ligase [Candidatus Bathyarchaeota archaeon]